MSRSASHRYSMRGPHITVPAKTMRASALPNLVALPIELLLYLFDYLTDNNLLRLGQCCRLFNQAAIPVFLQRKGIRDAGRVPVTIRPYHSGHEDELTGLNVHFSLLNIKHLTCILDRRPEWEFEEDFRFAALSRSPIAGFTQNLRRMQQLLGRLKVVGSLHLYFYPLGALWSLHSHNVQEFLATLFDLLDIAVAKSCTGIHIFHPHPLTTKPPYKFQLLKGAGNLFFQDILRRSRSLVRHGENDAELRGSGWRYRQIFKYAQTPHPMPHTRIQSRLTTLQLSSDFLLVPPFSSWTYHVIKHSPITSLSLSLPSIISQDEFHHYVFPRIVSSLPQLEELRVGCQREELFTTVVELLPSLTQLRKLTFSLTRYGRFPVPSPPSPHLCLSQLISFTGSPYQAAYIFGSPILCPNLQAINIIIDCIRGRPKYVEISKQLSIINYGISGIKPIPKISICLSSHGTPLPRLISTATNEDSDWTMHFVTVSRLTLELPLYSHDETVLTRTLDYVLQWMDIFRNLTALTLTTQETCLDPELLSASITADYPNITAFNVVEYPKVQPFHCHWSNSGAEFKTGAYHGAKYALSLSRSEENENCACSSF